MKKTVLLLAFMLISVSVYASLPGINGSNLGTKSSSNDQLTRNGEFGVQIFTTLDEKETRSEWSKRTGPLTLNGSKIVKRGSRIYIMFIFTGAKSDVAGKCNVTAKTKVIKPDGSLYEKIPTIILWDDKLVLEPGILELGKATIGLIIESQDLLGKYIVKTIVTDNVSKAEVTLETDFESIP